jgi:hypothetical protein
VTLGTTRKLQESCQDENSDRSSFFGFAQSKSIQLASTNITSTKTTMSTNGGTQYLGRLALEETFGRLCRIFGQRWGVFICITVIAYLMIAAVTMVSFAVIMALANTSSNDYAYGSTYSYAGLSPKMLVVMAVDLAIYYAIMCVADGAIIRAVAEMYVGQVPTVFSTLQNGLTKLGPLFCTAVVIGAAVGIPAIAIACVIILVFGSIESLLFFYVVLCCFLIWVVVVTYHIYPAIVVEDAGTFASISRSFELSSGSRCHIFTTLLIFFVVKWICGALVSAIGSSGDSSAVMTAKVLETIINVIFASLGSVYVPLCIPFVVSFLGISHTFSACASVSIFCLQSPGHCLLERPLREGRFERKRLDDGTLRWFRVGWRGALRGRHHERRQDGRLPESIGVKTKLYILHRFFDSI